MIQQAEYNRIETAAKQSKRQTLEILLKLSEEYNKIVERFRCQIYILEKNSFAKVYNNIFLLKDLLIPTQKNLVIASIILQKIIISQNCVILFKLYIVCIKDCIKNL